MKQIVKNAVVAIVGTNFEGKKSRIGNSNSDLHPCGLRATYSAVHGG